MRARSGRVERSSQIQPLPITEGDPSFIDTLRSLRDRRGQPKPSQRIKAWVAHTGLRLYQPLFIDSWQRFETFATRCRVGASAQYALPFVPTTYRLRRPESANVA